MHPYSTAQPLLAAGIDWLTATARPDRGGDQLGRLVGQVVTQERDRGNRLQTWQWRGYGGIAAGGASFGTRADGVIARLSGATAAEWAPAVAALAENVTRCDLQVTWMDHSGDPRAPITNLWATRTERAALGRRGERELREPEVGKPHIYFGKRASENFGRIYNKHADRPLEYPPGAIRAEIEAKGRVAEALHPRVANGDLDIDYVLAFTNDWFHRRGIALPIPPGRGGALELPPRAPTDAQRTVRWLAGAVAPSVARSLDWVGLWPTLKALGLDAAIQREYGLCAR